jgi:hypothetical protein
MQERRFGIDSAGVIDLSNNLVIKHHSATKQRITVK